MVRMITTTRRRRRRCSSQSPTSSFASFESLRLRERQQEREGARCYYVMMRRKVWVKSNFRERRLFVHIKEIFLFPSRKKRERASERANETARVPPNNRTRTRRERAREKASFGFEFYILID